MANTEIARKTYGITSRPGMFWGRIEKNQLSDKKFDYEIDIACLKMKSHSADTSQILCKSIEEDFFLWPRDLKCILPDVDKIISHGGDISEIGPDSSDCNGQNSLYRFYLPHFSVLYIPSGLLLWCDKPHNVRRHPDI